MQQPPGVTRWDADARRQSALAAIPWLIHHSAMAAVIDLSARHLFGNEAAEDEDENVFQAYALSREEVDAFADPLRKLCFARAYKGEGKSALLRLTATQVARNAEFSPLIVAGPVTAFAPSTYCSGKRDGLDAARAELGRAARR